MATERIAKGQRKDMSAIHSPEPLLPHRKGSSMSRKHRILAVDDNPTNLVILEELLGDDYDIRTATTGEEALLCAPAFRPDLILLDIMMPGMDGYETCRRLRVEPDLRHTKIVMVSAKAMASERLKGYEAGADDYITKPFDVTEMLAKVQVYVRLKTVEEVDALKTSVLSLLSHETNTPLHGIIFSAGMLKEEDVSCEERFECAEIILASAMRLQSFFEKVSKLSALKAQTVQMDIREGDISAVARDAVCEMAALAEERNIRIEEQLTETAVAPFDSAQIKEVIKTILDNALRFSPDNGCVQLQTTRAGDTISLSVTDQGPGIAPDIISAIFEGFHSTHIRHHSGGHSLSLAIARHILHAHQGTISVSSTPGSNTTFTVQLPVAASAAGTTTDWNKQAA